MTFFINTDLYVFNSLNMKTCSKHAKLHIQVIMLGQDIENIINQNVKYHEC